jgi:hypothetical protein
LGKIIDSLTGQNKRAGSGLRPCTTKVSAYRILGHRRHGNRIVLVDTPGSENRNRVYIQTLKLIKPWGILRYVGVQSMQEYE